MSISNPRHKYSPIYQSTNQFINLLTDGQNGQRDTSVGKHTEVRISRPIYQRRRGDAYRRTQIDGQAVSISKPRHQYLPINKSIYQLIDLSTDG